VVKFKSTCSPAIKASLRRLSAELRKWRVHPLHSSFGDPLNENLHELRNEIGAARKFWRDGHCDEAARATRRGFRRLAAVRYFARQR
jgi:hypothetical protein